MTVKCDDAIDGQSEVIAEVQFTARLWLCLVEDAINVGYTCRMCIIMAAA